MLKPSDTFTILKDGVGIEFEVAEEGGYVVSVPELPGCMTQGDTFEEAMAMVEDAMEAWLESAAKHGDPIPRNSSVPCMHSGATAYYYPKEMVRALRRAGFELDTRPAAMYPCGILQLEKRLRFLSTIGI